MWRVLCCVLTLSLTTHAALDCERFYDLSFSLTNFQRYPRYFSANSSFLLPAVGKYEGAEGIEEYVKYFQPTNPAIAGGSHLKFTVFLKAADQATGLCEFVGLNERELVFDKEYSTTGETLVAAILYKLFYNPAQHIIDSIVLHARPDFINHVPSIMRSHSMMQFVCSTMQSTCPEIWSLNGLQTQAECVERLNQLPTFDHGSKYDATQGGGLSGYSLGCRVIHSVLLSNGNTAHCPHISFVAKPDSKGHIKCQTSSAGQNYKWNMAIDATDDLNLRYNGSR